jgi:isobutyryl-CoA mutase
VSLAWLQRTVQTGGNAFGALMDVVKFHSLGQISGVLYDVGGEYRRNM